jgi:hypothetical protein
MELAGMVNSVRLAKKVKEALKIPLAGMRYFMDSSAFLDVLRTESGKFAEFVGARVSEVKVNSNVEEKWLWLDGNCNSEDLGTRSNATLTARYDSAHTSQHLAAISHGCGQFHPQILWANLPSPVRHRLCKTAVNVRVKKV